MYQTEELTALNAQIRKRWILVLIPAAIALAGVVAGVVMRNERAASVLTVLTGAVLIFGYDLFIKPLRRYRAHLEAMLSGIRHDIEGVFEELSLAVSSVDGVDYYSMHVTCVDDDGKPYDRLFYYDAAKERPAFQKGERIVVTYNDRQVAAVRTVG